MTRTLDSLPATAACVPKGHAVVLGASLAGLLAARVLSRRFQWVTVLERENLPAAAQAQAQTQAQAQAHKREAAPPPQLQTLLARGRTMLERLFPGLTEALLARGAATDALSLAVSRPLLETELRQRVRALPNVCLREGAEVLMPRYDLAAGRVNGVCYRETASGATQELAADWVVDCTGRGSHNSTWLAQWGYAAAPVCQALPHSERRRFDKLRRFPLGFLVMGDAQTRFPPNFAQGLTLAACQAQALDDAFARGGPALAQQYFKACARVVNVPWHLAMAADRAQPEGQDTRPLRQRLVQRGVNALVARLRAVAQQDAEVAGALAKVVHLVAPPASLFAPRLAWRVLKGPQAEATMARPEAAADAAALAAAHA